MKTRIATDALKPGSVQRLVGLWNREEAQARKHATDWENGNNWKGKPDPQMAEVCRMKADILRLCAMQLEEANAPGERRAKNH